MKYEIIYNDTQNRFEAISDGDIIGLVDYHVTDNVMRVTHTEVNSEYEGQGIAASLTQTLLEYAKAKQYTVRPICPYTRVYISRHPEYQSLIK